MRMNYTNSTHARKAFSRFSYRVSVLAVAHVYEAEETCMLRDARCEPQPCALPPLSLAQFLPPHMPLTWSNRVEPRKAGDSGFLTDSQ